METRGLSRLWRAFGWFSTGLIVAMLPFLFHLCRLILAHLTVLDPD